MRTFTISGIVNRKKLQHLRNTGIHFELWTKQDSDTQVYAYYAHQLVCMCVRMCLWEGEVVDRVLNLWWQSPADSPDLMRRPIHFEFDCYLMKKK